MSTYYIIYGFKTASGKVSVQETLAILAKDALAALEYFKKYATKFVLANLKYLEVVVEVTRDYGIKERVTMTDDQVIATDFLATLSIS